MPQYLLTYFMLLCSVMLAGGASLAASEYPATFQSGDYIIQTLEQFEARNQQLHPTLDVVKTELPSVEYQGQEYPGLRFNVEGIKSGTKIILQTTYIEPLPGLWRLVFVKSKFCIEGTILENKKEVRKWFCEDDPFPIKGYDALFLVADANVDLELLQLAFKEPLVPYGVEEPQAQVPQTMTLGDLEKSLQSVGSSMSVSESSYIPVGKDSPKPAIEIHVQGSLDSEKTVDQKFKYAIAGDRLKMKEIDGKICWFAASLGKQICDPVYQPTPASSLPLELINSWEVTGAGAPEGAAPVQAQVPQNLQCGDLITHLSTILKVHFQRSLFDSEKTEEARRYLVQFPEVADPLGLMISDEEKKNLLNAFTGQASFDAKLKDLVQQMASGKQGNCGLLVEFKEKLQDQLLQKSAQVFQVLNRVQQQDYALNQVLVQDLSPYQQGVLRRLEGLLHPVLIGIDAKAATDVAMQKIKTYIEKSLDRASDLELFTVSAMAKQDAYSTLFEVEGEWAGAILGHAEKKYFGLSVDTGLSGKHYVVRLHPAAEAQGLQVGDELLEINGQRADQMPYSQIDQILLDTGKPIDLTLARKSGVVQTTLSATELNPLSFYYSVSVESQGESKILQIQMQSFEPGIAQAIYNDIQEALQEQDVEAFVLDLRNNPGGNTDEAVNVLSLFARDRIVTLSKLGARHFSPLKTYEANPDYFVDDSKPLVVLVNQHSKSSSEIVASGYQALGRSVTIGEPTFGKLVGQFYIPTVLSGRSFGMLITAFEFFTVQGEALNGIGVTPDVLTSDQPVQAFDGGVGVGQNISAEDLPQVPLYNFSLQNIDDLGLVF